MEYFGIEIYWYSILELPLSLSLSLSLSLYYITFCLFCCYIFHSIKTASEDKNFQFLKLVQIRTSKKLTKTN